MSLSLKLLVIPAIGGAATLIPLSFKSDNSLHNPINKKIQRLGNCKEVKSKEDSSKNNSVGILVVCLEEKESNKKQVIFKWFKSNKDKSPVAVKWLTSTWFGSVQVQLEEDKDGKEELFAPSEEVFLENSEVNFVKPQPQQKHKFGGSNCLVQEKGKDWKVSCK